MHKILTIFGTRPEAIKMAPLIKGFEKYSGDFTSIVCVTAQHRKMLDQVLSVFSITPDYDLNIMQPGQDLFEVTCRVLKNLKGVIERVRPDLVLVHGDTTTTMAASLASFYCHTRVGHVEAGLRTRNKFAPYPEEINRKITGDIADFHFAPTPTARANLIAEKVDPASIHVTGNTVIDALFSAVAMIETNQEFQTRFAAQFPFLDSTKKLILVTGHRRENFGIGFENICLALSMVAERHTNVQILYPVHLNPSVQIPVRKILGNLDGRNIFLVDPVEYLTFVCLMLRAYIIVTDSGGVQEEAPSLSKPVLVMRDATERPEGVEAGVIRIVGTRAEQIYASITTLLTDRVAYQEMTSSHNPYGDGKASERIIEILRKIL